MKLRNVIVMFVLAALAILAFFALGDGGKTGQPLLPPTFPKDFDPKSVSRVVLTMNDGSLAVRRRADRSDAWEVEAGTTTVRADAAIIEDLLTQIARQSVQNKLDKAAVGGDLAGFGLATPSAEVELTMPGRVQRLRYGGLSAGSGESVYLDEGPGTDIWLVSSGVQSLIANAIANGTRSKRMTDIRLFDVGKVEIETGGVVRLSTERDASGIWRVSAPYKGYAHPTDFETILSKLVSTEVTSWVDIGAIDLKKYGLDAPAAEVRLTSKRGTDPVSILLGAETPEGGVYAFEKGVPNIALLPKQILAAALTDPHEFRDRSFTRLGIDGVAIKVNLAALNTGTKDEKDAEVVLPAVSYELRKEGSTWDITKPDRYPTEGSRVRDVLEMIRAWETKEFQDKATPADYAIDGKSFIEIERQGGGKTVLRFGSMGDSGTFWAQRLDADGLSGVERVDGAVMALLRDGYAQFRQLTVADLVPYRNELERIERNKGFEDGGPEVQEIAVSRDVTEGAKDALWRSIDGPGVEGTTDQAGVNRFVDKASQLTARGWEYLPSERNDEVGFKAPRGATASVVLQFNPAKGTPPLGDRIMILIGKKRPDGTYWARMTQDKSSWAFYLAESDLKALLTPFTK